MGNGNECEYESESVRRLLGYSMLGPVQWLTVHPDDREMHGAAHVASFTETMATGQPVWTCQEMRLRTRDGAWIWFQNRFCHSGARELQALRAATSFRSATDAGCTCCLWTIIASTASFAASCWSCRAA